MKTYTREELMIGVRKSEQKKAPQAGEFVQGIVFSVLTAQQHLQAAEILVKADKFTPAFGLFINAAEELGKVTKFADLLVGSWSQPEKIDEYKKKQKDHSWKLTSSLTTLKNMINNGKLNLSFTFDGVLKGTEGKEPYEHFLSLIDPDAAEKYHKLRLMISYSNFDGQRVSSPHHATENFTPEMLAVTIGLLSALVEAGLRLLDQFLPIFMDPIRECYLETSPKRISNLKQEINRRVNRTMPVFRKYFDTLLRSKVNKGLDEIDSLDKDELATHLKDENVKAHIKKMAELIVSHEEIEEVFFFPPLKDSAKAYYSELIENATIE